MNKKKLLDEIGEEQCEGFCIFKEIVHHDAKYDGRLLIQIYCVNKFKWIESERQQKDVGWQNAWMLWVNSGGAKIFAQLYDSRDTANQVWKKVIKELDAGK